MLLTGTHPRTLDDKNRLALPKRVREQLGDINKLYATQGQDQCLCLYAPNEFDRLGNKIDKAPETDKEVRVFRRLFFANTEEVDIDANGRILLPERLVEFAGLKHEVVLIGQMDHLELWEVERWHEYSRRNAERFDSVAERTFQSRS